MRISDWSSDVCSSDLLIHRYGEGEAKRFISSQVDAIDLVRALARDENMDIEPQGDGTLHVAHAPDRFRDLEQEAAILGGKFGLPVKLLSREEVDRKSVV